MKIVAATQAKNALRQLLDHAQREPVLVTKRHRPIGVIISMPHLEDIVLGERALLTHAEGYVGSEESQKILQGLLA